MEAHIVWKVHNPVTKSGGRLFVYIKKVEFIKKKDLNQTNAIPLIPKEHSSLCNWNVVIDSIKCNIDIWQDKYRHKPAEVRSYKQSPHGLRELFVYYDVI